MEKFVFDWLENIVEKGDNPASQHFLPFPQCFQEPSFVGPWKPGSVSDNIWGMQDIFTSLTVYRVH